MKILALEPFYGGSHKAFLDDWSANSRHEWTIIGLPAYHWKWRMRHSAISFADQTLRMVEQGSRWDLIFCSDMLNLAEFIGMARSGVTRSGVTRSSVAKSNATHPGIASLPTIVYFHENQLTYPVRYEDERDVHFELINISTCLAASEVWFNTAYHRDSFTEAVDDLFRRMPDHRPQHATETIRRKAIVQPQGVRSIGQRSARREGPLRILWNARWEFDKNPETFFEALKILKEKQVSFGLAVVGQSFSEVPPIFEWAKEYFRDEINCWGYQESREQYEEVLAGADVVASTSNHEFFGVAVVEAILAGAYPLLPNRLSYPEILQLDRDPRMKQFFYDGSADQLANRLEELASVVGKEEAWKVNLSPARRAVERFEWTNLAPELDNAIEKAIK